MRTESARVEKWVRATAFSVACLLGGGAVASCSDSETAHRVTRTPEAVTTTLPQSTTEPFSAADYTRQDERNKHLSETVTNFGAVVLEEYNNPDSTWGPFDAYCAPVGSYRFDASDDGWVSHGHKPEQGENCFVQHNPQYGGKQEQVMADVFVAPDGTISGETVGAYVFTDYCRTTLDYSEEYKLWRVDVDLKSPDTATSLAAAQALDNQAIACLDNTRP